MSHHGNELELNGLEDPDELQLITVTQQATQKKSRKTQTNLSLLQKSQVTTEKSAVKSKETNIRPLKKQHEECRH